MVHPVNEHLQYFPREDAKKEKEDNGGSVQGDGFLCGSAPRFPPLSTQLLGNAFNLLPLLRDFACKLSMYALAVKFDEIYYFADPAQL
jgi:hypothetical protein